MNSSDNERYAVRSIDRALDIIQCVAERNGALGVDDITAATGLPKSTVFRVLATLTARRFVDRDPERQTYRLGTLALTIGARALGDLDLRQIAKPHIERLMQATSETVHLAVLAEDTALCIDKIDSNRSVRMSSFVGFRDPLYCSGVGKALLAFQDEPTRRALLADIRFGRLTPHTIDDIATLAAQIETIRRQGYATDIEEMEEGLACIAAPIRDHSGKVIASVSISGPTTRVSDETMPDLIRIVRAAACDISHDLGFASSEQTA